MRKISCNILLNCNFFIYIILVFCKCAGAQNQSLNRLIHSTLRRCILYNKPFFLYPSSVFLHHRNLKMKLLNKALYFSLITCMATHAAKFKPSIDSLHIHTLSASSDGDSPKNSVSIRTFIAEAADPEKRPRRGYIQIKSKGTKEVSEKVITANRGIILDENTPLVYIASRGYAFNITLGEALPRKGGGLLDAYQRFRDNVFHDAPVVTFDYPDDRDLFNFGQKLDQKCLDYVYKSVLKKCPNAKIVLFGSCRGAKCVLEYATRKPKNLSAIILESPFISAKEMTMQIGMKYAPILPGAAKMTYGIFKWYFPNFNQKRETLRRRLHKIPHVPIFIAHRTNDALVSNRQIHGLVKALTESDHKHVYLFLTHDESDSHARLMHLEAAQQAVNAFLHHHGLPHDGMLALEGKELLTKARNKARSL